MSSHSCRIGKASPQCGCRNVSLDYELKCMSSHSCHIGKASPQCGCRNGSSDYQLWCMSSHSCHTGKASPPCGPSCVSWDCLPWQWSSHTGHRSSHQCSPSFYSATSLLRVVGWTGSRAEFGLILSNKFFFKSCAPTTTVQQSLSTIFFFSCKGPNYVFY